MSAGGAAGDGWNLLRLHRCPATGRYWDHELGEPAAGGECLGVYPTLAEARQAMREELRRDRGRLRRLCRRWGGRPAGRLIITSPWHALVHEAVAGHVGAAV